ncbi:MAG: MoaD/ThiS family protein [bacterium]
MAILVRIPTPLRKLAGNRSEVICSGSNIVELIDDLDRKCPGIKGRICGDDGSILRFINIFVNEEDIRFLDGIRTPVKEGDTVSIIPAISGGA